MENNNEDISKMVDELENNSTTFLEAIANARKKIEDQTENDIKKAVDDFVKEYSKEVYLFEEGNPGIDFREEFEKQIMDDLSQLVASKEAKSDTKNVSKKHLNIDHGKIIVVDDSPSTLKQYENMENVEIRRIR